MWYTVCTLDLTIIAERIGMTASDYFSSPVADITITASSTGSLTNLGSNASSLCLSQCLSQVDCQSFVLDTAGNSCVLFAVARTNNNTIISSGTQYYEKDNNLVTYSYLYIILHIYINANVSFIGEAFDTFSSIF